MISENLVSLTPFPLKKGELTEKEWAVMKKHPVFAYEIISSIPFLRLTLDIHYCRHEKWDGTGYPRGLNGEQIPLLARVFAIVVWDALLPDRPYRPLGLPGTTSPLKRPKRF